MWITYQQTVNTAKIEQHIWWRTNDSIQDVDKKCEYVDNSCGYLVCKLFVIKWKRAVDCEYLDCYGW